MPDRRVDLLRPRKAHLQLLRMHVDVQLLPRDLNKKRGQRVAPLLQQLTVALGERVQKRAVAHKTMADEEEGRAPRWRSLLGRGQKRTHLDPAFFSLSLVQDLGATPSEGRAHPLGHVPVGRQIKRHAAVAAQTEVHLGMGQRQTQNRF